MTREDKSMMLSTGKTVREELREILIRAYWDTVEKEEDCDDEHIDAIERVVALWMEEYVFPGYTA